MHLIEITGLTKTFKRKDVRPQTFNFIYDILLNRTTTFYALRNVNLKFDEKEIVGIIGENGAGKTTLLRVISQILIPDAGKIMIKGKELKPLHKRQVVSSEIAVFDLLDARMTLEFYADLYDADKARINQIIRMTDLERFSGQPISRFSTGMLQRLKLAKVLLIKPRIILFDEPTRGLDMESAALTKRIIMDMKDSGKTILLSTHKFEEIGLLCDKVVVLSRGEVKFMGTKRQMLDLTGSDSLEDAYLKVISR